MVFLTFVIDEKRVKLNDPLMGTETRLILQPFFLYPSLLN